MIKKAAADGSATESERTPSESAKNFGESSKLNKADGSAKKNSNLDLDNASQPRMSLNIDGRSSNLTKHFKDPRESSKHTRASTCQPDASLQQFSRHAEPRSRLSNQ